MKNFLLIALLLISCSCSFAYVSQGNWRWRKDYGPEHLDAPQGTNQNIPITITSADSIIRLRAELYVKSPEIDNYIIANNLYYSNDSTTWIKINATNTSNAFIFSSLDSESSAESTTQQLIPEDNTSVFFPGVVVDAFDTSRYINLRNGQITEYEWILRPTKNIVPGQRYLFRAAAGPALGSSVSLPSLMVAGVLPVTFLSFTVQNETGKAVVRWATANEQDVDRYEVWRSRDSRSWELLSTTKSIHKISADSYQVYDHAPLLGKSYYKIKQYDRDGFSASTSVQTLLTDRLQTVKVLAYPNPFTGSVLVQIPSQTNAVKSTIKVIDMQGRTWLTESTVTGSVQIGSTLPKGIYQLQVWQNHTPVYHTTLLKQ